MAELPTLRSEMVYFKRNALCIEMRLFSLAAKIELMRLMEMRFKVRVSVWGRVSYVAFRQSTPSPTRKNQGAGRIG